MALKRSGKYRIAGSQREGKIRETRHVSLLFCEDQLKRRHFFNLSTNYKFGIY